MVAGGAILALYGIWQFLFGLPQLLTQVEPGSPAATRLATGRVFSRFLLPSAFASFLLLVLPQAPRVRSPHVPAPPASSPLAP